MLLQQNSPSPCQPSAAGAVPEGGRQEGRKAGRQGGRQGSSSPKGAASKSLCGAVPSGPAHAAGTRAGRWAAGLRGEAGAEPPSAGGGSVLRPLGALWADLEEDLVGHGRIEPPGSWCTEQYLPPGHSRGNVGSQG